MAVAVQGDSPIRASKLPAFVRMLRRALCSSSSSSSRSRITHTDMIISIPFARRLEPNALVFATLICGRIYEWGSGCSV